LLQDRTAEEQADWTKHQQLVELIVKAIVNTRETLRSEDLSVFEQFSESDPDLPESLLDQHYTMACLKDIYSVVKRTLRTSSMAALTVLGLRLSRSFSKATAIPFRRLVGQCHGLSAQFAIHDFCNSASQLGDRLWTFVSALEGHSSP
jgi:hypothetical protein